MPELTFTGQTDERITVQLPSRILYAKWRGSATSAGGTITIEVLTQWVGNTSDITINVKDREDNLVDTITGKVWNNLFRKEYIPAPNATQGLYFEVDMSAHGLSARSNIMRVFPTVSIENMRFLNAEEAELESISENMEGFLKCDIVGPPDGTKALIKLYEQYSEFEKRFVFSQEATIESGSIIVPWSEKLGKDLGEIDTHNELAPDAGEYYQPKYWYSVECYATKETSDMVPVAHEIVLEYVEEPGVAGRYEGKMVTLIAPDGTEEEIPVPADGRIVVENSMPGRYSVDDTAVFATEEAE
ncbi:MAG: hypothetical protein OCD01_20025 [Fibrobacterales bacterium]